MTLPRTLRRIAIAILTATGLWLSAGTASAGPVLIELFTSQGCSNCPAADALLGEYVDRDDVVALSLPVDYWNYLGWTDTFAKAAHTERQRGYAAARGDGQVYTPQIVVAGRWHMVGSDRAAIDAAIAAAAELPSVDLSISLEEAGLHIGVGEAPADGPSWGTWWIVMFDETETVEIGRGENAGRTVTYHHIALEMHRVAMWRGDAMSIELPLMELAEIGADGCVVILQQDGVGGLPGPVIGAATYTIR